MLTKHLQLVYITEKKEMIKIWLQGKKGGGGKREQKRKITCFFPSDLSWKLLAKTTFET